MSNLIQKNQYKTDKQLEKNINKKIGKSENKIPYTSELVNINFLNTEIGEVGKKLPDISGLLKKTDYNAKISDIELKYFTASYYNRFTDKIRDTKLKEENLATNSDLNTV